MNIKNIIFLISIFLIESIPLFGLTFYLYHSYFISTVIVIPFFISLAIGSLANDKKFISSAKYIIIFLGVLLSLYFIGENRPNTMILTVALSMMVVANFLISSRRILIYILVFSFLLFLLYIGFIPFNDNSITIIIVFTYAFFMVVIIDYYYQRVSLQTNRVVNKSYKPPSFMPIVALLLIIIFFPTAIFYSIIPQPKAIHYGAFPFEGGKSYKGIEGETKKDSPFFKDTIKQLPNYKPQKESKEQLDTDDILQITKITKINDINDTKTEQPNDKVLPNSDSYREKELKKKNRLAYYSYFEDANYNKNQNPILFDINGSQSRFLRGKTYDYFDGNSWKRKVNYIWNRKIKNNQLIISNRHSKSFEQYTITVKGKLSGRPIIYAPTGIVKIFFPTDILYRDPQEIYYAPSQLEVGTFYMINLSRDRYYGYDIVKGIDIWYKKAYLKLPKNFNEKILQLAQKLTKYEKTPFEKAEAIIKYFKRDYKFKNPRIHSLMHNQKLEEFLFDTKIGNPVQFNTALVVMLRSVGVYSRIATGYAPSEYNEEKQSFLVERENSAIWSEVYVSDGTWVVLHPSDDIAFEGEEFIKVEEQIKIFFNTILLLLIIFLAMGVYYFRKYIWRYRAKWYLRKYKKYEDIKFVTHVYQELERYYKNIKQGSNSSDTLQEYEKYIKALDPKNSHLIEYLTLYYNQAIYNEELDANLDRDRYFESAMFLVYHSSTKYYNNCLFCDLGKSLKDYKIYYLFLLVPIIGAGVYSYKLEIKNSMRKLSYIKNDKKIMAQKSTKREFDSKIYNMQLKYKKYKKHKALAIAVDRDGKYSYGYSYNKSSIKKAIRKALKGCNKSKLRYKVNSQCKIYKVDDAIRFKSDFMENSSKN